MAVCSSLNASGACGSSTLPARSWHGGVELRTESITPSSLAEADCVAILTDHQVVDYDMVLRSSRLIVDTRNAIAGRHPHVLKLGSPSAVLEPRSSTVAEKVVA